MSDPSQRTDPFGASRDRFAQLLDFADGSDAGELDHAALEEQLTARGRQLLLRLYQDHLDLRAEPGSAAGHGRRCRRR